MEIPLSVIEVDKSVKKAAISALESGRFILGKNVEDFEEEFAKFCWKKRISRNG